MQNQFKAQLEAVIKDYESAAGRTDGSNVPVIRLFEIQTKCLAAIERALGNDSVYSRRAIKIGEHPVFLNAHVEGQIAVAKSLLSDITNGYANSITELAHADVFSDYLEMADHLASTGYKDPAAVLSGSTLEAHLRQLCAKHGVAATLPDGRPMKADTLNADLVKAGGYSKLDQKSITAWLGLRNDAAHGHYGNYDIPQVNLMTSGIRDFITRNPA